MVSTERVLAYGRLESEASLETYPPSSAPPSDWPSNGQIELKEMSYRHSPKGPQVLNGISCVVQAQEKVQVMDKKG